jgi:uncharacterized integral membrane protein
MKQFSYIVAILFLLLALIFAMQNVTEITVNFFTWTWSLSLSLLVIIIFLIGLICGLLLLVRSIWRKNKEIKSLKRKNAPPL